MSQRGNRTTSYCSSQYARPLCYSDSLFGAPRETRTLTHKATVSKTAMSTIPTPGHKFGVTQRFELFQPGHNRKSQPERTTSQSSVLLCNSCSASLHSNRRRSSSRQFKRVQQGHLFLLRVYSILFWRMPLLILIIYTPIIWWTTGESNPAFRSASAANYRNSCSPCIRVYCQCFQAAKPYWVHGSAGTMPSSI